jgi:fumarate hydratase subunit alpha
MREISTQSITDKVAELFIQANYFLPEDVLQSLKNTQQDEISPESKEVLRQILENAEIASQGTAPLCQDCGVAVVFLEVGQEVHLVGGKLSDAVNEGVRKAYDAGFLRKSIVDRPFSARINTKDNTPAMIHYEIVEGDKIKIIVMPKGGGAENMSKLFMLTPADGRKKLIDYVVKSVDDAGSNPCPPVIVGVGIGGTSETTMLLAKKSLLRKIGENNPDKEYAELEQELLEKINGLGIGSMGYGGKITALAVNVEVLPCHLASLPIAVNFNCHSSRHKEVVV